MNLYQRVSRRAHALMSDLKHGGFTGGDLASCDSASGLERTVSTAHYLLEPLIDPILRHGDVFVDVGCGKGRVLNWVLDDDRAGHVFGIEINKVVAAKVARRLRDEERVTIIAGDALTSLPDSGTLFYMWNPFDEPLMHAFKAAVLEKLSRLGTLHEARIIYHHCLFADVWRQDARCHVTDIALPLAERHRAVVIEFR